MRIVSNKPNTLKLHDNLSNSSVHLYFRSPTTKEVAGYTNGMTKRVRNKLINCTGECRQKHGENILEGWREGDFGIMKDDQVVVISSDPQSQDYNPKWKEIFCEKAADLVERLAIHAFEQTSDIDDGIELSDTSDDGKEPSDPN